MKLKGKKIEIFSVTHSTDADGFAVETIAPITPLLWAYFRHLFGKAVFAAQSVQATE